MAKLVCTHQAPTNAGPKFDQTTGRKQELDAPAREWFSREATESLSLDKVRFLVKVATYPDDKNHVRRKKISGSQIRITLSRAHHSTHFLGFCC